MVLWFLKKWSKNLPASHKDTPNISCKGSLQLHLSYSLFKTYQSSKMHRNQKITKNPQRNISRSPLGTPTPKEREGSSMLTWDPCRQQRKKRVPISMCRVPGDVFIVFHLDILLDSLTHSHSFFFFVWMLQNRNPLRNKANGEVLGPTAKGWAQEGLKN